MVSIIGFQIGAIIGSLIMYFVFGEDAKTILATYLTINLGYFARLIQMRIVNK